MKNKIVVEFYSSKRCFEFVKGVVHDTSTNILDILEKKLLSSNDVSSTLDLISILKSDMKNQQKSALKFKIIEVKYGLIHYDKMSVPRAAYIIDIYDIITCYLNNPAIKELFEKKLCISWSKHCRFIFWWNILQKQAV